MRKGIVALLLALVVVHPKPPIEPCEVYQAVKRFEFIENEGLEYKRVTCYLPTGSNCADGSPTEVGTISTNKEHLGQKCILYRADTLEVIGEYVSHDIGGHKDLVNGSAIDVFAPDMDAAWEWIRQNGDHVYLKWIDE